MARRARRFFEPTLSLRTWLVLSHLLVLTLPVLSILATGALAYDLRMQTKGELANQGALISLMMEHELARARVDDPSLTLTDLGDGLSTLARRARESTLAGVRILDTDGVVIATSGTGLGEDYTDRPEVVEAMGGDIATQVRPRARAKRQPLSTPSRRANVRVFLASPIFVDGELVGIAVLSRTPREELQALYHMSPRLALGALLSFGATLSLSLLASYLFSRSLLRLANASHRLAEGSVAAAGELDSVQDSHVEEVAAVGRAVSSMTSQLQERLAYIGEFAGNVSHEFKTPISTLRGTLELLREDEDMPAAQRERFMANAEAELLRLERLVSGLLRLARAEEGAAMASVDLDALAHRLVERHPEIQVEGAFGSVHGNDAQLFMAVSNLIENASRYGGEHVVLRGISTAHEQQLEVEDDGPGISPANQAKIFERFFTTDRAGGGTGLGLALVNAVARSHRGLAEVESRPGQTIFRLRLPVR